MTKMKGFFKGMKFLSQIFVHKEHEMEIGYPTDVKHVAHIGWDNAPSVDSPTWMNEFKTTSDFSSTSFNSFGQTKATSWAPKDIDQPKDIQSSSTAFTEIVSTDKTKTSSKKDKKKKIKSSSPKSQKNEKTQGPHRRVLSGDPVEWWFK